MQDKLSVFGTDTSVEAFVSIMPIWKLIQRVSMAIMIRLGHILDRAAAVSVRLVVNHLVNH